MRPAAPSPFLGRYDRILALVDRASSLLVIAAMAVLTAVVIVQVFFRYVLNRSLDWGWDVPRLCFIAAVLLAIPLALSRNLHVGVDLVIDLLGAGPRRLVRRVNASLMAALMLVIAYYAVVLAFATWDQRLPGLDLSVGLFYVALLVCAIHSLLHLLRMIGTGAPPPRRESG
jgi:TRAP-type C4-dicarboxylate transport system permease small subunit